MTPRTTRSRWQLLAVVAVIFGLLAAACGSSDDTSDDSGGSGGSAPTGDLTEKVDVDAPGVTDSEIRYSILSTATGNPTGQCLMDCYATGIEAYFDYVNTEMGGIYGRKLVADDKVDDEFGKNQEKALEILAADDTFGTFGNSVLPTGWADLAAEGVPMYVWSTNPVAMEGNESIFGEMTVRCLSVGCWDRSVPYQMKISGRTKLAAVGYGIAQSSKDCAQNQADSVDVFKDQIGGDAEAVYMNDNLAFGVPNGVAPEVTAMKNAGANVLVTCIVNNDTKAILQEAKRQNLDIVALIPQGYDQDTLDQMGADLEGGYIRGTMRSLQADLIPIQEKYLEYVGKNGGQTSEVTIYGWVNAMLAVEGLAQAGPDFSREKVVEGTNQLTGWTAEGFTQPLDWSTGHEAPTPDDASNGNEYECYNIMQIQGGEFVVVGDKAKPFTCWPGRTWDWDSGQPEQLSFD